MFIATGLIGYFFLIVCAIDLAAIPILAADPATWEEGKIGGKIIGGSNMPIMHLARALGGDVLMGFLSAVYHSGCRGGPGAGRSIGNRARSLCRRDQVRSLPAPKPLTSPRTTISCPGRSS